jgi:hypothetical protein
VACAKALVYPYQSSHLVKAEEAARPYPPHNLAHVVGWHFTKPMMLHCSSAHLLHRTPQRTDRPTDVSTAAGRNGQLSWGTVDPRLGPHSACFRIQSATCLVWMRLYTLMYLRMRTVASRGELLSAHRSTMDKPCLHNLVYHKFG